VAFLPVDGGLVHSHHNWRKVFSHLTNDFGKALSDRQTKRRRICRLGSAASLNFIARMKASYFKYSVGDRCSLSFVLLAPHFIIGIGCESSHLYRKCIAVLKAECDLRVFPVG
jgi:hypothetical protein